MRLIDSHAHIYAEAFDKDRDEVLDRAREAGLEQIYMPNIDSTSIDAMLEVGEKNKDFCFPMMGLHPCSVGKHFERELYIVEEWLEKNSFFTAVGEIGTDLYWDDTFFKEQQEAFRVQCHLALKHQLPVVIHCRNSIDETIGLVGEFKEMGLRGVFHCFTGSEEQSRKITEMGFYLGFGGVSTFKNGGLEGVITEVPLDRLLLETDSPYLAPVPHRGKRNEPAYVREIAEKIAEILDQDVEKIGEIALRNTRKLFSKIELQNS